MSKQTAVNLFMEPPSLKYVGLYQELLNGIVSQERWGNRLVRLAEQAHALRQFHQLKEIGFVLSNSSIEDYRAISTYFLAVAANSKGSGNQDEARRLFELAINTAPDAYKVKSILSLGALSFHKRDFDSALYFYQETIKAGKLSAASLHATKAISVLRAIEGHHKQAVKELENILPVIKYAPAHIYFDLLNSYAVELGEVGRKDEARNICRTVIASPFASAYPEWLETAEDLKQTNRSFVAINTSPFVANNVLLMPTAESAPAQSSADLEPARVLDLQRWKKKMGKGKKDNSESALEDVDEKEMLMRIMHIYTRDETTSEKRRKMYAAIEEIASEMDKTETEQ
jgi:tetratricopeptide (TPR) repeat protein